MTDNDKATPTPWEIDALGYLRGPNGEHILEIHENAQFVVEAVNERAQLLRDVKDLRNKVEVVHELWIRTKPPFIAHLSDCDTCILLSSTAHYDRESEK